MIKNALAHGIKTDQETYVQVVMRKLNGKTTTDQDEDEDTLMFDLIDDFCLIVEKATKRVSFKTFNLFLGFIDVIAIKCICFGQLCC